MAIAVKAVFNYSATAAITTNWSLTASTSIAVGDTLVLAVDWITSTSGSASIPFDNAGNVWTQVANQNQTGQQGVWVAPVTTTTANFQIAVTKQFAKTVSGRAAHLLVLTGAHVTNPIDTGSIFARVDAAGTTATYTLSTSLTTTVGAGMLFAVAAANTLPNSLTFVADAAWTTQGAAIKVSGVTEFHQQVWTRAISTPAIYNFSASISTGANTHIRRGVIFAIRELSGSISGGAALVFGATGTVAGTAATLSGQAALSFGATGTITGSAATLSGQAAVVFGATGTLVGTAATLSGQSAINFGAAGNLIGTAATLSGQATVLFGVTGTLTDVGGVSGSVSGVSDVTFGVAGTITGTAATLSGQAALSFGLTGTLAGTAATLSGQAAVTFSSAGNLTGTAATLSGQAAVAFNAAGNLTGTAATLSAQSTVVFGLTGTLGDLTPATGSASGQSNVVFGVFGNLSNITPAVESVTYNSGGGSWDANRFRRLLEQRRKEALARAQEALALTRDAVTIHANSATLAAIVMLSDGATPAASKSAAVREASLVAQRLTAFSIASARQAWKLKEQEVQLSALQMRLSEIEARLIEEDEDDEFLLLVA